MFKLVFDFSVLYCTRCETSWNSTATAPGNHTMYFVFDDKMIYHQRFWLKFSQLIKHLLFYIPHKICKHSLDNINFIASVYELSDNPSYLRKYIYLLAMKMNLWQKTVANQCATCSWLTIHDHQEVWSQANLNMYKHLLFFFFM